MTKAVRCFSKSGNTRTIAEAIAEGAGVPAVSITEESAGKTLIGSECILRI